MSFAQHAQATTQKLHPGASDRDRSIWLDGAKWAHGELGEPPTGEQAGRAIFLAWATSGQDWDGLPAAEKNRYCRWGIQAFTSAGIYITDAEKNGYGYQPAEGATP